MVMSFLFGSMMSSNIKFGFFRKMVFSVWSSRGFTVICILCFVRYAVISESIFVLFFINTIVFIIFTVDIKTL